MYPHHINEPAFANALVDSFLEISMKNSVDSSPISESQQDVYKSNVSGMGLTSHDINIVRGPSDFPDAKPGCCLNVSILWSL